MRVRQQRFGALLIAGALVAGANLSTGASVRSFIPRGESRCRAGVGSSSLGGNLTTLSATHPTPGDLEGASRNLPNATLTATSATTQYVLYG